MTAQAGTGRTNQKQRTRMAIVAAARDLIGTGAEVTMPAIARAALVSEATAYRYFPDLPSLISEALAGVWPPPAEALAPVADSADPVERVAFACEFLLRGIRARQGSVRAMIAATITRPETVTTRPGIRFGLIDHALLPLEDTLGTTDPDVFAQLKRDLAVVVSAEAFFTLTDLCGLDADEAIASAVRTATTLTEAAVR
ncbi:MULTISPECIES: TetR/AcrR family transcriptional regulator [unclassified Streptomyces]|uniref:TetR/AcrR family transcriptional regulator n=1 Tax=unclassified Streptomyces TaxID=2593676 RepID=UPI00117D71CE|nr:MULTISPECIES: TetR/AcrR family transcriptional regulator [unclassified Streptomyces]TRO59351.1 TetR/AcrR family transcriptional regulator [Streptomyces sp. IB201691-2A2]